MRKICTCMCSEKTNQLTKSILGLTRDTGCNIIMKPNFTRMCKTSQGDWSIWETQAPFSSPEDRNGDQARKCCHDGLPERRLSSCRLAPPLLVEEVEAYEQSWPNFVAQGPHIGGPGAWFNVLLSLLWNGSQIWTRGPLFSFCTGPCKRCSHSRHWVNVPSLVGEQGVKSVADSTYWLHALGRILMFSGLCLFTSKMGMC